MITYAYTPDKEEIVVLVSDNKMSAYDIDGYSYQWEDGYCTWKSDKPSTRIKNKVRRELIKHLGRM